MHTRIPEELKLPFEREIRRSRLNSSLRLYPALVIIFSTILILVVFVKAHLLVELVAWFLSARFTEQQVILGTISVIVVSVSLGLVWFLRHLCTSELFADYLYCSKCNAFDFDEIGRCPCCTNPLKTTASFFFTVYDDEKKIVQQFGLVESRKEGNQPPDLVDSSSQ